HTFHCMHQIPTRDSCIADSSRRSVHRTVEFRGAGRNRASQTLFLRSFAQSPAALPKASLSPDSVHKFRRSASPDTKNPTGTPVPAVPLLPAQFLASSRWLFGLPRSSSTPSIPGASAKSHRSTAQSTTATSVLVYPGRWPGLQRTTVGATLIFREKQMFASFY